MTVTTLEELSEMNVLESALRTERGLAAAHEITLGRARGRFTESLAHDVRYAMRDARAAAMYT